MFWHLVGNHFRNNQTTNTLCKRQIKNHEHQQRSIKIGNVEQNIKIRRAEYCLWYRSPTP